MCYQQTNGAASLVSCSRFAYDETVVVVQGRATVVMENGQEISLEPGGMAFFGRGQSSTWTIHEDFRKAFHADSPEPLPF